MKNEVSFSWLPNSPRLSCPSHLTLSSFLFWARCLCFLQGSLQWLPGLFLTAGKTPALERQWMSTAQQPGREQLNYSPAPKCWFLTQGWAHRKGQGTDRTEPVCPLRETSYEGGHRAPESYLETCTQQRPQPFPVFLLWGGLLHTTIVANRIHYFCSISILMYFIL